MRSRDVPVLVNITVLTALSVPIAWDAKVKLVGETSAVGAFLSDGAAGASPPFSALDDFARGVFGSDSAKAEIKDTATSTRRKLFVGLVMTFPQKALWDRVALN